MLLNIMGLRCIVTRYIFSWSFVREEVWRTCWSMEELQMKPSFKCTLGKCCKVLPTSTAKEWCIAISSQKVRPENIVLILDILLDAVGNIKYSDFGAAKVFAKQGKTKAGVTIARTNLNSMTGTPMYMSPEGTS